jgi:hypothetical protein
MGLAMGLCFRAEQLVGFSPVAGLQTLLLAGLAIMDVIDAAIAAVETESLLHFLRSSVILFWPRVV